MLPWDRLRPVRSHDPAPDAALPPEYWETVLRDPRVAGKSWLPIQRELSGHLA
jgi:hypothetical protein